MPTQPENTARPTDYKPKKKKKNKGKGAKPQLAPAILERADEGTYNNSVWGQKAATVEFDVVTPSGQRCRLKKMSVEELVFNGSINDLDAISQLVETIHLQPRSGKAPANATKEQLDKEQARNGLKMLGDPAMKKAFNMVDNIVTKVVVAPEVHIRPEGENIKGRIYVDMIDIEDRFFIFSQVMGGMENAATFRQEPSEALGAV